MSNPGGYTNHPYYSQHVQYPSYQGYPNNGYPQQTSGGKNWGSSWDPYNAYQSTYYPNTPQYPHGPAPQIGQYGESSDNNGEPAPPGTEPALDTTLPEQQGGSLSQATASSQVPVEVGTANVEKQSTLRNPDISVNPPPPLNPPAAVSSPIPPPDNSDSAQPTPLMSSSQVRPYENSMPQNPDFQGQATMHPSNAAPHLGQQSHYYNQQSGYADWQANCQSQRADYQDQWPAHRGERPLFRGQKPGFRSRPNIKRTVYRTSQQNSLPSHSPPRQDAAPVLGAASLPLPPPAPPQQQLPPDLVPSQPVPEPQQSPQSPPKEDEGVPKPTVPQHACELPNPMKAYVTKCFTLCQNEVERDAVEKYLKEDLNRIVENGNQWNLNFSNMPLPPILRKYQQPKQKQSRWDPPAATSTESPIARPQSGMAPFTLASRPAPASNTSVHPEFGTPLSFGRNPNKRGFQSSDSRSVPEQKPSPKKKKLRGKMKQFQSGANAKDQQKLSNRSQRFQIGGGGTTDFVKKVSLNEMLRNATNTVFKGGSEDGDWCEYRVQGTSTSLLKQYLRLTSAPDPSTVRAEPVLRRSLQHIKDTWRERNKYRGWTCEQLKSVRQDLTVQGVRNSFTVEVYETHARVALEMGDHEEFNQCQNQLKELYIDNPSDSQDEFLAYRILYSLFTKDHSDIANNLASVSSRSKDHPAVVHALKLRKAWMLDNYHAFFKLYKCTPNLGVFLLNKFVARERLSAFKMMMKAYVLFVLCTSVYLVVCTYMFMCNVHRFAVSRYTYLRYAMVATGTRERRQDCKMSCPVNILSIPSMCQSEIQISVL